MMPMGMCFCGFLASCAAVETASKPIYAKKITPAPFIAQRPRSLDRVLSAAAAGNRLEAAEITRLFAARGPESDDVIQAADELRQTTVGGTVRYVVNRNINYTNVCYFHCRFCAFSKGKTHEDKRQDLKKKAADRDVERELARRAKRDR